MAGTITPLPIMLQDEADAKTYQALQPPKTMVVRFGNLRFIAELPYSGNARPGCGSKLVIRTKRGIELATMLTTTCTNSGCSQSVSRKQMLDYIEASGGKDYPFFTEGKILRVATIDDINAQARLDDTKAEKLKFARNAAADLKLPMQLIDVELLLGGERLIFYYLADDWVDFRQLVKRMASEYQTRIEMYQVNARNEARLVGDYEKCGQHCCCKQFLKVLKPVSMRSAKVQKATLDPTKISGRCGRLMCCLRYEDQTYQQLQKKLPYRQSPVQTPEGTGIVIKTQILTQLVLVRLDEPPHKIQAFPVEDLCRIGEQSRQASGKSSPTRTSGVSSNNAEKSPSDTRTSHHAKSAKHPSIEKQSSESGTGEEASASQNQKPADQSDAQKPGSGKKRKRRRRRRHKRGGKS